MCGIAGLVNCGDRQILDRMTRVLAHRGPDDEGVWWRDLADGGSVGLGSRRLAILDLSPAGHQPMSTPDGSLTVTYNGELYNYPALRRELEGRGHRFRSNADTEALLYLYQDEGPEFVRRLQGMFALALWDAPNQRLFLARDHFGVKPLYYHHAGRRLWFASEIKAILEDPAVPRRMDRAALHAYMTMLWVPDPQTMFEGIAKLPPGHYALFRDGDLALTPYWDLVFPPADHECAGDEAALAGELRARFWATVQAQMLSDVPVGAFLSAGLDSSGIVAAMAAASDQPVRTFTISFPPEYRRDVAMDDTDVAARTAAHLGALHTEIRVEPDVVDLLPRLIWHMDEPVADPALITAYLVARAAREHVTVLLSGVGGDEVLAGYRKYRAHTLAQHYQRVPGALRRRVIEPAIRALPAFQGTRLGGYVRLAKKMARSGSLPPRERFLMDSVYLTESQLDALYTPELRAGVAGVDPFARQRAHFEAAAGADFLNQMLYVDLRAYMASLNLLYNDKMGMAASVEVRVPFLDWTLAEWLAGHVPPDLKLRGGVMKYLYRGALARDLPAEVFRQPKAGFGAPVGRWLNHELRNLTDDLLSAETLRRRGLFVPEAVGALIQQHRAGAQVWSYQLWQFITLELWMQAFLD